MTRILIAGIGNIFMGDDGFGCEVVRRLLDNPVPEGVDAVDFGIRGMDLGYALTAGYDCTIFVDTIDRGGAPGTLYVIEPDVPGNDDADAHAASPHGMDPATVLRFAATLGGTLPSVLLVGCQPAFLGGEDGHMGLSPPVVAAVSAAVDQVRGLLHEIAGGQTRDTDINKQRTAGAAREAAS